jgi:hypothetical protein
MNIYLPPDLKEWPLLDKELHFINPARVFTPENFSVLSSQIDISMLNKFRLGFLTQQSCCYPRFNLSDYLYNIKPNCKYNILPDANPSLIDFTELTDARVIELENTASKYEKVYLFWSGGIDSTLILCAVLKNCSKEFLSKLVIVLNHHCIAEFPEMYSDHIFGKLAEVSTDEFIAGRLGPTNNALYITGDVGDPIFGYDSIVAFDTRYPELYKKPWMKNKDKLTSYFSLSTQHPGIGKFVMEYVEESLNQANIEVDTVYDLLWWTNFNWGYDIDLYMNWWVNELPETLNARQFHEENLFLFYNCRAFQNWAVASIGTNLKVGETATTHKKSAKQYILEYTGNTDYFINKMKEDSAPKNIQIFDKRRLVAVDTDYNFYYGTKIPVEWR